MPNKYLLIDYGNTCLKIAIFDKTSNKLSNCFVLDNIKNFKKIYNRLAIYDFKKILYLYSVSKDKSDSLLKLLKSSFKNTSIHIITKNDFINDIDFSNINKNVIIGNDILLLAYYLIKNYKTNALLCLGTVYFCIVIKNKMFKTVEFIPNSTLSLKNISNITSIPNSLLPNKYDKEYGLTTSDAFSSGSRNMLDGYVELIGKKYKLNHKDIIISGGDVNKFKVLSKKYKLIENVTLIALAFMIKDKKL